MAGPLAVNRFGRDNNLYRSRVDDATAAAVAAGMEMVLRVRQIRDAPIAAIGAAIGPIAQPVIAVCVAIS